MRKKLIGVLAVILVAAALPASAEPRQRGGVNQHADFRADQGWRAKHYGTQGPARSFDRRNDHAQFEQRQRIEQGIRSGELTRNEANRLIAEQRALEAQERRYLADGRLTRAERADMLQDLNAAGRHIYNESHDAQFRR